MVRYWQDSGDELETPPGLRLVAGTSQLRRPATCDYGCREPAIVRVSLHTVDSDDGKVDFATCRRHGLVLVGALFARITESGEVVTLHTLD